MTELASGGALETAAWKVKNLDDYDARLERAARRVDELAREHGTAALVIYEAVLMKSGRPVEEVRRLVREFEETFEDEETEEAAEDGEEEGEEGDQDFVKPSTKDRAARRTAQE